MGGIYPGDTSLLPLWAAIHAASFPVFIHPLAPCDYSGPVMPAILAFPGDLATAAASIIYAGLFERLPTLKVTLSHYGGGLASMGRRLDMAVDIDFFPPGHGQNLPQLPSRYLQQFYVDTAQGFHRPACDCGRAVKVGLKWLWRFIVTCFEALPDHLNVQPISCDQDVRIQ